MYSIPWPPSLSPKSKSLHQWTDLKNTSDDAIPNYLNSLKFKQTHFLSDVRLGLGYGAFLLAAACFGWDYLLGFDATKTYTMAAVGCYMVLSYAMTRWQKDIERGQIYVGSSPDGKKEVSGPLSTVSNYARGPLTKSCCRSPSPPNRRSTPPTMTWRLRSQISPTARGKPRNPRSSKSPARSLSGSTRPVCSSPSLSKRSSPLRSLSWANTTPSVSRTARRNFSITLSCSTPLWALRLPELTRN